MMPLARNQRYPLDGAGGVGCLHHPLDMKLLVR